MKLAERRFGSLLRETRKVYRGSLGNGHVAQISAEGARCGAHFCRLWRVKGLPLYCHLRLSLAECCETPVGPPRGGGVDWRWQFAAGICRTFAAGSNSGASGRAWTRARSAADAISAPSTLLPPSFS